MVLKMSFLITYSSSVDTYADFEKRYPDDSPDEVQSPKIHGCIRQFSLLKKKNRHLKVVLSIGGLGKDAASSFATLSASPETRATFVQSALRNLKDHGFDGLDIYWEWPTAAEARNYTILLGELRAAINHYAAEVGSKHLTLSVACPAGRELYTNMDLEGMDRYLDFWNLMAYDYANDSTSSVAAHQANVFTGREPKSTPYNPAQAISDFLDFEIEPEKIILGCPLFGRGFANTEGLGKAFSGCPTGDTEKGVRDYKNLPIQGAEVKFDAMANASYTYDDDKKELFSYDNPDSLKLKSNFIQSQSLGGAMFWEASGDRQGEGSLTTLVSIFNFFELTVIILTSLNIDGSDSGG